MRTTYAISKDDNGRWALTVSHSNGGSVFTTPTLLGRYSTRKAALVSAQLLAGRTAHIEVFS
jgi:hypothetical protein